MPASTRKPNSAPASRLRLLSAPSSRVRRHKPSHDRTSAMSRPDPPILEVRNVSQRFGGVTALTDVSLGIRPGEVVALVGDNGAGKSTLVKIISGIQRPTEGEIYFAGSPLAL